MNGISNGYTDKHVKKEHKSEHKDKHRDKDKHKDRHKEHKDKEKHKDKDKQSSSGKVKIFKFILRHDIQFRLCTSKIFPKRKCGSMWFFGDIELYICK